ncbi:MAG: thioredoxin fold domain-containing protein [Bacteroidetes bacterium]|nr:thioredoxin fold domain-containing protein [Bacteroidota bacterium]
MRILIAFFLLSFSIGASAQKTYGNLYQPEANATEDIAQAIKKAAAEGKHVIVQGGGNWCGWCYKFHDFIEKDAELKKLLEDNYVLYHLNYSPDNQNEAVFAQYGYAQRFGFPVLIILDGKGNRIHTQDTGLLESGEGYDRKKVMGMLQAWTPAALDPATYKKE